MSHYGSVPFHLKINAIRGAKYDKYMYHPFIYSTMKRKNNFFQRELPLFHRIIAPQVTMTNETN